MRINSFISFAVALLKFTIKPACFFEICAPPTVNPFKPDSSINLDAYEFIDLSNREYRNSVTYALNGSAEKVKGTFVAPAFNYVDSAEYSVSFYNENGKLLYQSPIMTESVAPVDFEFDARNALKLKVEFNGHSGGSGVLYNFYCIIKDFALITTDY